MCGIAGFIHSGNKTDLSKTLRDMASAMSHRGPDDEGFFETITRDEGHYIGLAHRRLSIIDLSKGHQPLGNEDGTIQIVFNGEIYNYQELRQELIQLGHHFTTNTDTETVVHAYEEYGEQCVYFLRGMFAFAIWDAKQQKMFLARDRFGKKPLFLYENNGSFYFASEIKSLLRCPDIKTNINQNGVYKYLAYRYVPGPETLFQGIFKLPPSSIAVWQNGVLSQTTYYEPADRKPSESYCVYTHPIEQFMQKLEESVAIRMVSDVPFGAFLSGGIDSSAVVALMTRHSSMPVKTFSVGFREQQYSELNHAKVISSQFKTDHHELIVTQADMVNELERLVSFRDAPVSEPADIPVYLLAKEARKTVKMVLTGEGSDEILGGYNKHVFERYSCLYQKIPRFLRHKFIEPIVYAMPYSFKRPKTAVKNLGLENKNERLVSWFGALSFSELNKFTTIPPFSEAELAGIQFDTLPGNSPLRNALYFDQTSWLPDNLLERGDRMTMAASLEARMPFMDHELVEFVSSLPEHYRVKGLQTKRILRLAMKQLLPDSILNRPKVGFSIPINEWFRGPMKDYLLDHLSSSDSITRDYFDKKALDRVLKDHIGGRQNHEKLLWTLLNLEIWHRLYGMKP